MICQGPDCDDEATRGHYCLAHYRQAQRNQALRPKRLPHGALSEGGTVQVNVNLTPEMLGCLEKQGPTVQDALRAVLAKAFKL